MADAYKVKQDTSLPRALRLLREDEIEGKVYETVGVYYRAGDYVLAENVDPNTREAIDDGQFDAVLESVDRKEAEDGLAAASVERGVFIPEHEVERYAMVEYGHETVPKDQVLELRAAGADAAKSNLEAAKSDGLDERPQITEQKSFQEVPNIAEVSQGEDAMVPKDSEHVDEEVLQASQVEQPPGLPVGKTLAAAEGEEVEKPKARPRPSSTSRSSASQDATKKDDDK